MRKGNPVIAYGAGVIADDSPAVIGEPTFNWHEGEPRWVLVVEEVEEAA